MRLDDHTDFFEAAAATALAADLHAFRRTLADAPAPARHGQHDDWQQVLDQLPETVIRRVDLAADTIRLEGMTEADERFRQLLMRLHPWRKGPFHLLGVDIDTEWRSDWKWQRLEPHLQAPQGALALDVGCGNGYHCWRLRGAGARFVVGIDPTLVYRAQFLALKHYLAQEPVFLLPLKDEELPRGLARFDLVLSLGVIYHRRSPAGHLRQLWECLRSGGQLVLESLVIEQGEQLVPRERYARMRNVWCIPGVGLLERWIDQAGFRDVRCVGLHPTSLEEQRRTPWMQFESLEAALLPGDPSRTVEGYPAPVRAMFVATKP